MHDVQVVDQAWITQSILAKRLLPTNDFLVPATSKPVATKRARDTDDAEACGGAGGAGGDSAPSAPAARRARVDSGELPPVARLFALPLPKDQLVKDNWEWSTQDSMLFVSAPDCEVSARKVAGFDIDGTITVTKSGKKFPQDGNDWRIMWPEIVPKLAELQRDGYKIVLFTNQKGVTSKSGLSEAGVKQKLLGIAKALASKDVHVQVFAATSDDWYRKPRVGMWEFMARHCSGDAGPPSIADSLYCGDAAGRPKDGPRKKDFSAGDLKFALNLGCKFYTPEALFRGSTAPLHCDMARADLKLDPRVFPARVTPVPEGAPTEKELVILVGCPGSGKSFYAERILSEHVRINQDELKTLAACKKKAVKSLAAGESIIIDRQNRTVSDRKVWIELARKAGARVRCVHFDVAKDLVVHLNTFRGVDPGASTHRKVPTIVINTYYARVETPTVVEDGIDAVKVIDRFQPMTLSEKSDAVLRSFCVP